MSSSRKRKRQTMTDPKENINEKVPSPAVKKMFTYTCERTDSWTLAATPNLTLDCEAWEDADLQALKAELNLIKETLSDIDIGKWHSHTGSTQLGGAIQRHVQKHAQAEMCTQAWCKFHEMLCQFDIVHAARRGNLKSVHLCEAPGAFVASLNHFLKSRGFYSTWEWLALSSNPYYEGNEPSATICDDTLIRDTRSNWFFGVDNSGDLLKIDNLMSLVDRTGRWTAHLVTADGSINCADRPAEQEAIVAPLHLAQVVSALYITAQHGSFVLKMFTLFETTSVSLLYLLNYLFTEVYVFKPMASKPGNSEVYVICEDYRGIGQDLLNQMVKLVAENRPFILPRNLIPDSFMQIHKKCCSYFTQLQTQTIQLNLELYQRQSRDWLEGVMAMRQVCAKKYIEENQIKPIQRHQKLLRREWKGDDAGSAKMIPFHFSVSGSFNQRLEEAVMSWRDKMADTRPHAMTSLDVIWLLPSDLVKPLNGYGLKLTIGTPPVSIRSSRYCQQRLLDDYNAMLANVQHLDSVPWTPLSVGSIYENLLKLLNLKSREAHCLAVPGCDTSDFVSHGTSTSASPADYRIHLGDVTSDQSLMSSFKSGELTSKMVLYDVVTKCLKVLELGDCFSCRIYAALSRFTVSIVYLLKILFFKVTVTNMGDDRYCYIVCCGYLGADNCLSGRLLRARNHGDELLQIIPVDWMEFPLFRKTMTEMNHQVIVSRLNNLIVNERRFLNLEDDGVCGGEKI